MVILAVALAAFAIVGSGADPKPETTLPEPDYKLYVERVISKGTNLWVRFQQLGGKPIWVREGKPDGPVGGVPDWENRELWKRISHVAVDSSATTNIRVIITVHQHGTTNTWSVPFTAEAPRTIMKEEERNPANNTPEDIRR